MLETVMDCAKFDCYQLELYKKDILQNGLRDTWIEILQYVRREEIKNTFLSVPNLSELYEIGLMLQNKQNKKKYGQYYTPDDVAGIMADFLSDLKGENICDVACGTGKLIITYLDLIGKDEAVKLISDGHLYLYDNDETALNICKTILEVKYGNDIVRNLNIVHGDFLNKSITLPHNSKVICNPPYSCIESASDEWDECYASEGTKELYAMFMEKIMKQSICSVIITPHSFIGSRKFYHLRKSMNQYNGFIASFDNVPGNIFCGRKHGIFNTNTANSVRAAITVVGNKPDRNGFCLTPLIRFKNSERKKLLQKNIVKDFINETPQIITKECPSYCKCDKHLSEIWETWKQKSNRCLNDYLDKKGKYQLSMPKTCRYYTVASQGVMKRSGQITFHVNDEDIFNFIYCLINSSFVYWYWRMYDGGITYPQKLLRSIPLFYDLLNEEDKQFFRNTAEKMLSSASRYVIYKKNFKIQESIKFPRNYRDIINRRLLDILGVSTDEKIFDRIHSNMALEINV